MAEEKKIWGDYEVFLDQCLGKGGMGAVYKGRQVSVNRPVAIKVIKKDLVGSGDFIQRFQREAQLLARLVDTHIVQVFGAGQGDGDHYYAMEYVEGSDLSAMLKKGKKFNSEEVTNVAFHGGKALAAAWKHKIVHRDIKPSNILITSEGDIKVMDFGLAKNPDMELTVSNVIMGTAKYISPEQAMGSPVDIRADIYSMGAVLYEIATGKPPFIGESPTSVIYQHVHRAPVPPKKINPDIPASLEALILRCLAKKPEHRYQTPDELIADARALRNNQNPDDLTLQLADKIRLEGPNEILGETGAQPRLNRNVLIGAIGGGAVVLVLLIFVGIKVFGAKSPEPPGPPGPVVIAPPAPAPGTESEAIERKIRETREKADGYYKQADWAAARDAYKETKATMPGGHPDRDAVDSRITECDIELLRQEGDRLSADQPARAVEKYEAAMRLLKTGDPKHDEIQALATEAKKRITSTPTTPDWEIKYKPLREQADGYFNRTDWSTALDTYKRAQRVLPLDHGENPEIEERINKCEFELLRQAGNKAMTDGAYERAIAKYEESTKYLKPGDALLGEINGRILEARQKLSSSANPPPGPPPPPVQPPAPPPPQVDPLAEYKRIRNDADIFYKNKDWANAENAFSKAKYSIPQASPDQRELDLLIEKCRFNLLRDEGERLIIDQKYEMAVKKLEAARGMLKPGDDGIEAIESAIKMGKYKLAFEAAEKKALKNDYSAAARDFEQALLSAPDAERDVVQKWATFCKALHKAINDHIKADEIKGADKVASRKGYLDAVRQYRDLLKDSHGREEYITKRLGDADANVRELDAAISKETDEKVNQGLARGRDAFKKGDWGAAVAAFTDVASVKALDGESARFLKHAKVAVDAVTKGMTYVPAGKARIGDDKGRKENNGPSHEREFQAYLIDVREVSNEDYGKFLQSLADGERRKFTPRNYEKADPKKPVTGVSYDWAAAYAKFAGKRLPTEVEWEIAASWDYRTGTQTVYPGGNDFVKTGRASAVGCIGMDDAPMEITESLAEKYPNNEGKNSLFRDGYRVARGAYSSDSDRELESKVSFRMFYASDQTRNWLGFRCAADVD